MRLEKGGDIMLIFT